MYAIYIYVYIRKQLKKQDHLQSKFIERPTERGHKSLTNA